MRESVGTRRGLPALLCGGAASVLFALTAPGIASADTLCVQPEASCTGPNTYTTVQGALDAASGNGDGVSDTVLLGAATYTENVTAAGGNQVDIVGAGTGQTTITAPTGYGTTVVSLGDSFSTISALTIQLPATGNSNTALQLAGDANGITVTEPSDTYGFGVDLADAGATLSGSTVTMSGTGVATRSYSGATIRDSRLSGAGGFQGYGTIRRSRISSINSAAILQGASTIENSILEPLNGSGTFTGVSAGANTTSFNAELRNNTIAGDGTGGTGITVGAYQIFGPAPTVTASVTNTIIRGMGTDLEATVSDDPGPGIPSAQISIQSSNFDPAKVTTFGGGQVFPGSGNINADPLFTDLAGGDLSLTRHSPAVDRGDNGFAPSGPDLDGAQRVVDGDEDGDAVVDMGALEFSRATTISSLKAVAIPAVADPGEPVAFIADGSDSGDAPLTFGWSFDDSLTGDGAVEIHTFADPGTHTGTVTASNPSGDEKSVTVSVRIRGPETPVEPVEPDTPAERCAGRDATEVGTPGDDVIRGTNGPDVIAALGGDDKVISGGGRDVVCGGDGADKLLGRAGSDSLFGERGSDKLIGGGGKDRLVGGPDKDRRIP